MKKNIISLSLILLLAASLRLWQLGATPISMDWDEVALGYNAWSILLTGKDEYGVSFPVVMESFGDFKPALYTYLIIPLIPVFGLSEFSVRLPSAIAGVLAVLLTYFLVKELFRRNDLSLLASFLLAISPFAIQFSRVAFESNIGMFFNLAALLFFLKGLKKPILLSLSSLFLALSLYTYQSEKVFVPLLIIILLIIYWKKIFSLPRKFILISAMVLVIVSFPMVNFTFGNQNGLARAKGVSFLSDTTGLLEQNVKLYERDVENNYLLGKILDNRRVVYVKTVIQSYFSHFDLNWLFITGDSVNRHHAPQMALMYIFELPFIFLGIYFLIFNKYIKIDKKTKILIFSWILITPVPASFTTGVPHAVRTLNFLPSLQIIVAIGLLTSLIWISRIKLSILKLKIKYAVYLVLSIVFIFNFLFYLDQYFVQMNYYYAKDWIYGYKQLVEYLEPIDDDYKKIYVSNKGYMDNSYMFFLFYKKYNPVKYLSEGGTRISGIERDGNKFLNYEFKNFDPKKIKDSDVLMVGTDSDFGEVYRTIHTVNFPDGDVSMKVVVNDK